MTLKSFSIENKQTRPCEGGCPRQVWKLLIGLGTPRLPRAGQYILGVGFSRFFHSSGAV